MYIDIYRFEIACAKKKWTPEQAVEAAGLPADALEGIYSDKPVSPADAGKLAEALKAKVETITRKKENFWD